MIVNFALQVGVSLATAPPPKEIQDKVDELRVPVGEMVEIPSQLSEPARSPLPAPAPSATQTR